MNRAMTEDELFDALQAFLTAIDSEASALKPGRQSLARVERSAAGAPRTEGPYAAIDLIGVNDLGEIEYSCWSNAVLNTETRAIQTRVQAYEAMFRIDLYGAGSTDRARLFMNALMSQRATTDIGGAMVRRVDPATVTNELVQQRWESRAAFKVELAFIGEDSIATDVIEHGSVEYLDDADAPLVAPLTF